MVVNEVCGNESTAPSNMGGKKQCLEAPVKTTVLAKSTYSFASKTAMKDEANWNTAIAAKNLVPLPNIEGLELANTEAVLKTGRYTDYELKEGVAGVQYRFDLSICNYEALKTYKNSDYTRVFQITNSEEITCDIQTDGTVKGRELSSFIVGLRNDATDDDVPFVNVNLKFTNDVFDIVRATFDATELEGIFDVTVNIVSASATEIKFTLTTACSGAQVTSMEDADIILNDNTGSAHTRTFVAADSAGIYTLTGTGFANDFTVGLNGVVTKSGTHYEAPTVATLSGI